MQLRILLIVIKWIFRWPPPSLFRTRSDLNAGPNRAGVGGVLWATSIRSVRPGSKMLCDGLCSKRWRLLRGVARLRDGVAGISEEAEHRACRAPSPLSAMRLFYGRSSLLGVLGVVAARASRLGLSAAERMFILFL